MRPPTFAGGNAVIAVVTRILAVHASMRPPTFAGGNVGDVYYLTPDADASMRPPTFAGGNRPAERHSAGREKCFNEAADFCRRKLNYVEGKEGVKRQASMRPPTFAGGNRRAHHRDAGADGASMRPPTFAGGNSRRITTKTPARPLQ